MAETLKTKLVKQGRVFRFVEQEVERPDGRRLTIDKIEHPGAVVILPQEKDGRLIVLRQFRPAVGQILYEFPAGTLEKSEPPARCAERELAEECGKKAAKWQPLGTLFPTPGFCDEVQYLFFASELSEASAEKDEDELIETELATPADVERLITSDQMKDGKSLAIFLRARLIGLI